MFARTLHLFGCRFLFNRLSQKVMVTENLSIINKKKKTSSSLFKLCFLVTYKDFTQTIMKIILFSDSQSNI